MVYGKIHKIFIPSHSVKLFFRAKIQKIGTGYANDPELSVDTMRLAQYTRLTL